MGVAATHSNLIWGPRAGLPAAVPALAHPKARICSLLLVFCCCILPCFAAPASALGETIAYPGAALQSNPWGLGSNNTLRPTAGSVSDNSVSLNDLAGNPAPLFVFGGLSNVGTGGDVERNQVFINSGAVVSEIVYGGYAKNAGDAVDNSVTVNGSDSLARSVVGGESANGVATGNTVTINGGSFESAGGGRSEYGAITYNSVTINGGNVTTVWGGSTGSTSGVAVTGNAVTITGGVIGDVQGGASFATSVVTGNTVAITGGNVTGFVQGGYSAGGAVTGNAVVLSDGGVDGHVLGGFSLNDVVMGNTVVVGGGSVGGHIFGGLGYNIGSSATGNTVILDGSPNIGASRIYGGFVGDWNDLDNPLPGDARTGNTLQITGTGFTAQNVLNFQNYNFFLPPALVPGQAMLVLTENADTDMTNSTVTVTGFAGGTTLQPGQSVSLVRKTGGGQLLTTGMTNTVNNVRVGATMLTNLTITASSLDLIGTVDSVRANPQAKALAESALARHAFVNQGSDLSIGPGMRGILYSTQGLPQGGLVPFAAGSGGWSRYNTGSHVDVSGASMLAGLARRRPVNEGKSGSVLAGTFFEAGRGGYDSYNSFSNAASVKGNGDTSYYGGGLLGRYDFAPAGPGNVYVEASFRAGYVSTDFSSSDLLGGAGQKAEYDSGNAYYGTHLGLGYFWNITEKANLDFSTRYIWTHQDGDKVNVSGDPVNFKAVDSHRWRSGARFTHKVNEYVAPYAGAYYDHEFDGKARAGANGYSLGAAGLKGGTGVGELGLTVKPAAGGGFSFALGVQGYAGVREGVTGSLQLQWEF